MAREIPFEPPGTLSRLSTGDAGLPAVIPKPRPQPPRRPARWRRILLIAIAVAAAAAGGIYWATHNGPAVPSYIAWSNGRLEADEIDIYPAHTIIRNFFGSMTRKLSVTSSQ